MRALEMMLTPLADSTSLEDRLLRLALSYWEWSVSPSLVILAVTKAPLVSICKTLSCRYASSRRRFPFLAQTKRYC
jgi:hypothetical protein